MNAESIAKALGGRKAGGGWTARCPAHDHRTPSLSIGDAEENKVLFRCHAGCDQGRIIAALRGCGLWAENGPRCLSHLPRCCTPVERKPNQDDARRSEIALAIWQSARPAQRTPAETYLASRGIYLPPINALREFAGYTCTARWFRDGGAGTTGLLADRLQRNAILIDISPKYAEMARWRIGSDAPLFYEAAE